MDPNLNPIPGPPLDRLRDIHDLGAIPWWPLAPGWWVLLGAAVLLGLAAWHWRTLLRLRVPIPGLTLGSWRWTAAAALRDLRGRVRAGQDIKTTAGELSELLRRIAMARLGRRACAGLTGTAWLAWLAAHDPQGFPWTERGRVLLTAPYAPDGQAGGADLADLIEAAFAWVATPGPKTGSEPIPRGAARV